MTEASGFILIAAGLLVLFVLGSRRARRESPLKLKPTDPSLDTLAELERMGQAARANAKSDEQERRWLRPFGVFGRLVTYAALFSALFIFWPKDISSTPLAGLTLNDIASTAIAIFIGLFLIKALFSPNEDDETKKAWGWLGVLIVVLAVGALFYFRAHPV